MITMKTVSVQKHCITPHLFRQEKEKNSLHNPEEYAKITKIRKKAEIGLPCIDIATNSESGMVGAAWVQCRAFSRELPPETKVGLDG